METFKNILLRIFRFFRPFLVCLIVILVAQWTFIRFDIKKIQLLGTSMMPTYKDGTYLLIKNQGLQRGKVVVFTPPLSWTQGVQNKRYIKRAAAVEGDQVQITESQVLVNGKEVRKVSPELTEVTGAVTPTTFIVPKNKLFALGDNAQNSNDSLYEYLIANEEFLVDKSAVFAGGEPFIHFHYKIWED